MEGSLEEPSFRLQIVLGVGASAIGIGGSLLTVLVVTGVFDIKLQEMGPLQGFRVLLAIGYLIMVLPSAILGEYWWSQWRKKSFKVTHFAFTAVLLGSTLGSMGILSYVFELLLPSLESSAQVAVLGVDLSLVLILSAFIARIPKVRERLNKMYN